MLEVYAIEAPSIEVFYRLKEELKKHDKDPRVPLPQVAIVQKDDQAPDIIMEVQMCHLQHPLHDTWCAIGTAIGEEYAGMTIEIEYTFSTNSGKVSIYC